MTHVEGGKEYRVLLDETTEREEGKPEMDKSHARQPRNGDGEMSETLAEQYGLPTHVVHKPPSPSFTFASDVVLDIVWFVFLL